MENDVEDNPIGDGSPSFTQTEVEVNRIIGNESLETGVRRNWFVNLCF